jgi:hypothetical protein
MAVLSDYSFGRILVDGREHRKDLIVLPDGVVSNWWRKEGHSLVLDDLRDVLGRLPPRLIVGTGAYGRLSPHEETIRELERRGITVDALETEQAVLRYQELEPAETAAALHLTC